MTKIYLDIDGVILPYNTDKVKHVDEFIKYVVTNYPIYWLTTHCRHKEDNNVIPYLSRYFSLETMEYIKKVQPTEWNILKTEAIDFSSPFLWFDDNINDGEKQELMKHNVLDNWIEVNLRKDENHLGVFLASFPIPIQLIKNG